MRVLVDTNIFLDTLMDREGLAQASQEVLDWCEGHPGEAWIAWHTLSNLFYIGAKTTGRTNAMKYLDAILLAFEIAPCDSSSIRLARSLKMPDFEDALQVAAATEADAALIVTRNVKDFKRSPIRAINPEQFLKKLT